MRYRTRRLGQLGLVGRSRPYRERGSAPHHLWPTRSADALVTGAPRARRGERHEPNPLFLAHAATISELYVTLAIAPAAGTMLDGFDREQQARESFRDLVGRERAVAPDATITLRDDRGRELVGIVELDLGTMSRTRLRTKARGYADYHRTGAWRERHPFCPALLFLTTGSERADAFGRLLAKELADRASDDPFVAATCANLTNLARAAGLPVWHRFGDEEPTDLVTVLAAARAPHDQRRAADRAERDEFERLLTDPVALHAHLQQHGHRTTDEHERAFGQRGSRALGLLLSNDDQLGDVERTALTELAAAIDEQYGPRYATIAHTAAARETLERLGARYAEQQAATVAVLRERCGDGPHLRTANHRLTTGELLDHLTIRFLPQAARQDRQQHEQQAKLRAAYLDQRQQQARELARASGIAARMRGAEPQLETVDRQHLRTCPDCQEIIYPDQDRQPPTRAVGSPCPYCGKNSLETWTPAFNGSGRTADHRNRHAEPDGGI